VKPPKAREKQKEGAHSRPHPGLPNTRRSWHQRARSPLAGQGRRAPARVSGQAPSPTSTRLRIRTLTATSNGSLMSISANTRPAPDEEEAERRSHTRSARRPGPRCWAGCRPARPPAVAAVPRSPHRIRRRVNSSAAARGCRPPVERQRVKAKQAQAQHRARSRRR